MRILTSLLVLTIFYFSISSCTKTITEIEVRHDTVTLIKNTRDTLTVPAKDTIVSMNVSSWDLYSYKTNGLVNTGGSTYFNTAEGIKIIGQDYRLGARLQTKSELGFKSKYLYYKWKGNGGGQFAQVVPQIKYDPLTTDGLPAVQGVDWGFYSFGNSIPNGPLVQTDTWYYTRVAFVDGSDLYQVITATGNYDNKGGNVFNVVQRNAYTKHGYPSIRIGDPFGGTSAYLIVGEFKISGN